MVIRRLKVSELPEFDAAEYLKNEEDAAAYLKTVLEENDPALLAAADIARAQGMSQVAATATIASTPKRKSISCPAASSLRRC